MRASSKATLALAAALAAAPAAAQAPGADAPSWDNTISFSPILALFEVLVADYERRVGDEGTIGVGVGYWNYDADDADADASYAAFDVKGRFYPDRAFRGIELGMSLGIARVGYFEDTDDDTTGPEAHATGLAYGVEVGHGWLLGDRERWFLGVAIGAKRFWFGTDDDDLPEVMPTGRLSFGIAF